LNGLGLYFGHGTIVLLFVLLYNTGQGVRVFRVIDYYDAIHKQKIKLEVTDEVAKFLQSDNKRLERQEKDDKKFIAFSLNETTDIDGEESLTYEELIADENAYVDKNFEKKEFSRIIWNVVNKLEKKEAQAIKAIFKLGYKPGEVAEIFNMSRSAFSQFMITAIKHLRIELSYDEEFVKTEYYQNHYKEFADDVIKQTKESLTQSALPINLNQVEGLMKEITQLNKITEKLGIHIPEQTIDLLQEMSKPVKGFIKELKKNGKIEESEQNIMNVPIEELLKMITK